MDPRSASASQRKAPCPIPRVGLHAAPGVLLFLAVTLSCIAVGVGLGAARPEGWQKIATEAISLAACVLLCIYTGRTFRRAKSFIPLFIITAVLASYLSGSFVLAAVLIGLVAGIACGALALSVMQPRQWVMAPLVPLIALVVTFIITLNPVASLACLLPLPAAWGMSVGTRRSAEREDGPGRVGVICLATLLLGASVVALIALMLYRRLGTLDMQAITAALDAIREQLVVTITSTEIPKEFTEEMKALLTRENVELMIDSVINLLPGYFVVLLLILATVAQTVLFSGLAAFVGDEVLTDRVRAFYMSAVSCVVFVLAYILALAGSSGGTSSLYGTVAQNIYLILMPGLALSGLIRLMGTLSNRRVGCFAALLVFVAPLLLLVAPLILVAVEVIGRPIAYLSAKITPPEE